jgi:uncharacterized protein involved in outer membrane biogenesis
MKRLALAVVALLALASIGLVLFARSVLTGANVRAAVERQLAAALGQPVTIGGLGASVYPRVTMDLTDVTIGKPARLQLGAIHVGTGLRALFSRRIEHADVRIDGARVTLPLPTFGTSTPSPTPAGGGKPPVEIVSIDEIVLRDAEVISGGRTLRGDVELVPQGAGVRLRRVALAADTTAVTVTGDIATLDPIAGTLAVTAESLDVDRLAAFVNDFVAASTPVAADATAQPTAAAASPIGRLVATLKVGRATAGALTLTNLAGTSTITPEAATFEPIAFDVFGGRYEGAMTLALGATPAFAWRARMSGLDTAALMAFAGAPGSVTGTLRGTIALDGQGLAMEQALRSARGQARVDITDGTIAGLQLVRTLVTASSGRGGIVGSAVSAAAAPNAGGERFSRLGATLRVEDGVISTDDVAMASTDVDLSAAGTLTLAGMQTHFDGRAQLSEALSREAGTDLYRYTQEGGRVTLPVTVAGPIANLSVRVDVADAATRAIRNRAAEEIGKAIDKRLPGGLRGLFGPRKPR